MGRFADVSKSLFLSSTVTGKVCPAWGQVKQCQKKQVPPPHSFALWLVCSPLRPATLPTQLSVFPVPISNRPLALVGSTGLTQRRTRDVGTFRISASPRGVAIVERSHAPPGPFQSRLGHLRAPRPRARLAATAGRRHPQQLPSRRSWHGSLRHLGA
jgi:hypothetical protein